MDEIVFLPFRPRKWPVCMDEIVSGWRRWTARVAQVDCQGGAGGLPAWRRWTACVAQVRFFVATCAAIK